MMTCIITAMEGALPGFEEGGIGLFIKTLTKHLGNVLVFRSCSKAPDAGHL